MNEPQWIQTEAIRRAHAAQLAEHGGQEGLRDPGLLESALNRPRNLWAYSQPRPDIAALAAAYGFGLAKNHPFFDGNKRTAAVVCEGFLNEEGYALIASDDDWYEAVLALAAGELSEEAFAEWLRQHTQPIA
ncbi:Toxin Doc [Botrimarina colliarenosi]|uniref:Toxin Doc n=1 Tax=Botrimarina colliarenosi TaxID=2528001 RepID=A0A5C6AMU6_9BACT|nr:type II toxin-antitoxin system death-on-curing family toxin [Botrimarina colliarenosi]TWU00731.1 Toxin Doc [Botrimarina colliarenosi]